MIVAPRRTGAVVVLACLLAACGEGRNESQDGSRPPATTPSSTVGTAPGQPAYEAPSAIKELGAGTVVGVSIDATAAYVVHEDPESGVKGCEGMPAPQLFAVPLDGGSRRPATPAVLQPLGGDVLRNPKEARVAIVEECEEFFSRLVIATEGPGGQLVDADVVDRKVYAGLSARVAWSRDGKSLIAPVREESPKVVRVDLASGARTILQAGRPALQAAELADGSLAVLLADGLVIGNTPVSVNGFGFAVAPSATRLAVFGEEGLTLVGANDGRTTRLVGGSVAQATWSPDERAIAYLAGGRIRVVTIEDRKVHEIAPNAPFSPAYFTTDGKTLLFTLAKEGAGGVQDPVAAMVRFQTR